MEAVALKNDEFRQSLRGEGKVVLTRRVNASPWKFEILKKIREFTEFNKDNDPYGERDFGQIEFREQSYLWKFDYYNNSYEWWGDPQENGTKRVLTVMHSSEY